ncbi:MAG: hypothetical protein PHU86_01795 [Patescibacteria group bacterium]|jgi:hypothetical protein|nr:hypothetical protein [Patescibacteria group bacterium]
MKKGNTLLAVVLLLTALLSIGLALSSAVLSTSVKITKTYNRLAALSYAEGGVNKALWSINNTGSYTTTLDSSLPGGQFEATVTDCGANCKQITSIGYVPTKAKPIATRTVRIKINGVVSTSNISFKYGIQVDNLGTYLDNNATIKGSIFSNGPIINASSNTKITGAATSHASSFLFSSITNGTISGDARAFFIINAIVKGTKYTMVNPPYQEMPIKDADLNPTIDGWENDALVGGAQGNTTISGNNNQLGPKKIDGNLVINNNASLKVTGTLWVTGNITIGNNAQIYLDPLYGTNSGVIIADHKTDRTDFNSGRIYVNQRSTISGIDPNNPKTPSYIMLFSTQQPPPPFENFWRLWPAITIEQNSIGGVYYSPFGSIALKQNALARALACSGLLVQENGIVDYDSGMANSSLASGPAGNWTTTEWQALD